MYEFGAAPKGWKFAFVSDVHTFNQGYGVAYAFGIVHTATGGWWWLTYKEAWREFEERGRISIENYGDDERRPVKFVYVSKLFEVLYASK